MENLKYSKFNWLVEIGTILIIVLITIFIINSNQTIISKVFPLVLIYFLYGILTLVNYVTLLPSSIFKKKSKNTPDLGQEKPLSEIEKLGFIKSGVLYSGLFKLCLVLIAPTISFYVTYNQSVLIQLLSIITMIGLGIYFMSKMSYSLLQARGISFSSYKDFFSKGIFYNNPNDPRVIVDKPFGVGTTFNMGSKKGRNLFYLILAIPLSIMMVILFSVLLLK